MVLLVQRLFFRQPLVQNNKLKLAGGVRKTPIAIETQSNDILLVARVIARGLFSDLAG